MKPALSVIIPVHDDVSGLRRCLTALAEQEHDAVVEVIVGLDRPTPELSRFAAASASTGVTFTVSTGLGSYAARNAAAQQSSGLVLAFVDADAVAQPGWIATGLATVAVHGVVAGAVLPQRRDSASVIEEYDAAMYLRQEDNVEQGFGATANLWVTRPVWELIGAFDPALSSGGDLEWGRRAAAAGHPPVLVEDVAVAHETRRTARDLFAVQYRIARGWAQLADARQLRRPWEQPALRTRLEWVNRRAGRLPGESTLLAPHVVAMAGRWVGWLSVLFAELSRGR